jgi:chemotaxis protein MotB
MSSARTNSSLPSQIARGSLAALACLLTLTFVAGCARTRSRSMDRAKVLEAENINLRQKAQTMEDQMRQAHVAQDDAVAREQALRSELVAARQESADAAAAREQAIAAREQLAATQAQLDAAEARLQRAHDRYEAAQRRLAERRPAPAARPSRGAPLRYGGASPEIEAMRRDLQGHLAGYGVRNLNVEVRTDRSGQQRVAIVLPDAFPAGKATLAYNAAAVKAVISVGKMIREHYPSSTVRVEGHTDSDPIRKSNWGTNENLSRARAQAVETLLTNSGVPANQVQIEGLGATQPLAAGSTRRAKSRNRRVEIFISPRG